MCMHHSSDVHMLQGLSINQGHCYDYWQTHMADMVVAIIISWLTYAVSYLPIFLRISHLWNSAVVMYLKKGLLPLIWHLSHHWGLCPDISYYTRSTIQTLSNVIPPHDTINIFNTLPLCKDKPLLAVLYNCTVTQTQLKNYSHCSMEACHTLAL